MTENLPAERSQTALVEHRDEPPLEARQNISVAFLPLALVTFLILAFVAAAWTFLATAT